MPDKGQGAQPSGDSGEKIASCVIGLTSNHVSLQEFKCPLQERKEFMSYIALGLLVFVLLVTVAAIVVGIAIYIAKKLKSRREAAHSRVQDEELEL